MEQPANQPVESSTSSCNWFAPVLAALCGIGIGLGLGILIASLRGPTGDVARPSDTLSEPRTLSTTKTTNSTEQTAAEVKQPAPAFWERTVRCYGPGTPYSRILEKLQASGYWNPGSFWTMQGNFGMIELASIDAPPFVWMGTLQISGIDPGMPELGKRLQISFFFEQEKLWQHFAVGKDAGTNKTLENLRGAIEAIGSAGDLDKDESKRLRIVASLIPICRPQRGFVLSNNDSIDGMTTVVSKLPYHIREKFAEKVARLDEMDVPWPAIGFSLSKRWVCDLAFGSKEKHKRWEVHLSDAGWRNVSAANDPDSWPRLTTKEVDNLAALF